MSNLNCNCVGPLTVATATELGYTIEIVERRIPHTRITKDFLGFADYIAISPTETLAIQATSGKNHSTRIKKIFNERQEQALEWLACPHRTLAVWSFSKVADSWKHRETRLSTEEVRHGELAKRK